MALALKTPLEQEFPLEKSDAKYGDGTGEPTKVRFIQATQAAVELHDQIFSAVKKLHRNDSIQVQDQTASCAPCMNHS
jgi:hypothetical protein